MLDEGFFHGLGHGVGLEIHEEPNMGLSSGARKCSSPETSSRSSLGLYRPGFGGCRLEDLVLVTEGSLENLTQYPYDLDP